MEEVVATATTKGLVRNRPSFSILCTVQRCQTCYIIDLLFYRTFHFITCRITISNCHVNLILNMFDDYWTKNNKKT